MPATPLPNDSNQSLLDIPRAFGVAGDIATLPGGMRQTFRVGNIVLKQIHDTSLENSGSRELVQWIAGIFDTLDEAGFRIPRPQRTIQDGWITEDGWTAWSFLEGRHARPEDIPACIEAILAFHRALADLAKHSLLDQSTTPWSLAQRACLEEQQDNVHPMVAELVDRLYALRRPLYSLKSQLLHGDLNPENILVAPRMPPAFLDMSPFWGPVGLALAIFANWIGPRQGNASVLRYFAAIEHFDQWLVRAGIRMLLVMDDFSEWDTCPEREATQFIISYVEQAIQS